MGARLAKASVRVRAPGGGVAGGAGHGRQRVPGQRTLWQPSGRAAVLLAMFIQLPPVLAGGQRQGGG